MTHLRTITIEELVRRNYSDSTRECYIRTINEFALWSRMSGFFEVSMDETLRDAILYVFASLSGTMLLVWASFRLAGGSR